MPSHRVAQIAPLLVLAALGACRRDGSTRGRTADTTPPPAASQRCSQVPFLGEPLAPQRDLPAGSTLRASDVKAFGGGAIPAEELRRLLDDAVPLDPCDPSIGAWQYSPHGRGSLTIVGEGALGLELFLGGRGILTWPDGSRVMFDHGAPSWAPADAAPALHRQWHRDGDCAGSPDAPHFMVFTPGATTDLPATTALLSHTCKRQGPDRAMNIASWCCP